MALATWSRHTFPERKIQEVTIKGPFYDLFLSINIGVSLFKLLIDDHALHSTGSLHHDLAVKHNWMIDDQFLRLNYCTLACCARVTSLKRINIITWLFTSWGAAGNGGCVQYLFKYSITVASYSNRWSHVSRSTMHCIPSPLLCNVLTSLQQISRLVGSIWERFDFKI